MANLKWTKGGVLSATQLNKLSGEGSGSSTETQEIFWVTYGKTTKAQLENAIKDKKVPILKYNDNGDQQVYAMLVSEAVHPITGDDIYYFESFYGNGYHNFKLSGTNKWDYYHGYIVLYSSQSLPVEERAQARANIGAAAIADIPTDEHINELIAAYINNNQ